MATTLVNKIAGGAGGSAFTDVISSTQAVDATSVDGLLLATSQTATLNNQKQSPAIHFSGSQWVTGAVNAAMPVDVKMELVPIQTSSKFAASELRLNSSYDGGAYSTAFKFDMGGILTIANSVTISSGAVGITCTDGSAKIRTAGSFQLGLFSGGYWTDSYATELVTIAAAASTDTTIDLPADSIIMAVTARVTTVIPTATSFSIGDPTTAARFKSGVSTAANTTAVGIDHWSGAVSTLAAGPSQASAAKVRLTMAGGTPAANTGRVRVTIFYRQFVAPTS